MLIPDLVFVPSQARDYQRRSYPLKLRGPVEAMGSLYPIYLHHLVPEPRVGRPGGDVSSLQLLRGLRLIYCTSIKQRERSCFRHLKFLMSLINERGHHRSACLLTTSTRCQNRSAPDYRNVPTDNADLAGNESTKITLYGVIFQAVLTVLTKKHIFALAER